jgi:hypothetical protein
VEQAYARLSSCIEQIRESKMNDKSASDEKWKDNASTVRKSVAKVARKAQMGTPLELQAEQARHAAMMFCFREARRLSLEGRSMLLWNIP